MKAHIFRWTSEIAIILSVILLYTTFCFAEEAFTSYTTGSFSTDISQSTTHRPQPHVAKPTLPPHEPTQSNPDPIVNAIFEISEQYGIDPNIVAAIIWVESRGVPTVSSDQGRYIGLMQVGPRWHGDRMDRLGVTDLYDPYSNILVGVDYLSEIYGRCHDWTLTIMSYNLGEAGARPIYNQGRVTTYVKSVLAKAAEFQQGGISYGS